MFFRYCIITSKVAGGSLISHMKEAFRQQPWLFLRDRLAPFLEHIIRHVFQVWALIRMDLGISKDTSGYRYNSLQVRFMAFIHQRCNLQRDRE